MHGSLAQGIRNTSTGTDRPRQTDTDTDTHKHRQTKTDGEVSSLVRPPKKVNLFRRLVRPRASVRTLLGSGLWQSAG